ncbi:hypothetical protein YC2023_071278 [Brassica napus]
MNVVLPRQHGTHRARFLGEWRQIATRIPAEMKSHCCFSGTAHGVCDCLPHGAGSFA